MLFFYKMLLDLNDLNYPCNSLLQIILIYITRFNIDFHTKHTTVGQILIYPLLFIKCDVLRDSTHTNATRRRWQKQREQRRLLKLWAPVLYIYNIHSESETTHLAHISRPPSALTRAAAATTTGQCACQIGKYLFDLKENTYRFSHPTRA